MTPTSPAERLREIADDVHSFLDEDPTVSEGQWGFLRMHLTSLRAIAADIEDLRDALEHALGCWRPENVGPLGQLRPCPQCEAARGLLKEGR